MIYKGSKSKEENSIIVECECSTHSMKITSFEEDSEVCISMFKDNFYGKQNSIVKIILNRIKLAWRMLRGKEYYLEEIIIDKKDLTKLINTLQKMKEVK